MKLFYSMYCCVCCVILNGDSILRPIVLSPVGENLYLWVTVKPLPLSSSLHHRLPPCSFVPEVSVSD